MSFIQGKTIHGLEGGEEVPLKQQGTLPEGYGARASSMELEEASGNRAGWLGGCDFHIRRAGPIL